jgi:hypothetical protein
MDLTLDLRFRITRAAVGEAVSNHELGATRSRRSRRVGPASIGLDADRRHRSRSCGQVLRRGDPVGDASWFEWQNPARPCLYVLKSG